MPNEDWVEKDSNEMEVKKIEEFPKFIADLARSLRSETVLEVGCKKGLNLLGFPESSFIGGIDENENLLDMAKNRFPDFKFKNGSILKIPFPDSSFDFVFTVTVMNSLGDSEIPGALNELFRVSKKYILNCEFFNEKETVFKNGKDNDLTFRNMYQRWLDFKVKIISNVDFHEEIDPEKKRFTLVKKL